MTRADVLAQPCTRRDLLAVLADLAKLLAESPAMLASDAIDIVWQRYTVEWRHEPQPTRATDVDVR